MRITSIWYVSRTMGDVANLVTSMMEATLYDFEDVTEQMQIMNEEATAVLKDLQ